MEIGYYPGCALHGSSNDYDQSVRACLTALGVRLREPDDWICCGATAAHCLNATLAVALPARNLALAQQEGMSQLLAPCPMCSMELHKANQQLARHEVRARMKEIIELDVDGRTRILNLIEVLQQVDLEEVRHRVVKPLCDLRPACYYGCLLTRPPDTVRFDDPEQPRSMESILGVLGAEPVDWNFRTECCGAGLTVANEQVVLELSQRILEDARENGANCLVVACPMCHVNLDMKQVDIERRHRTRHGLVVYYLSDLVGRALGLQDRQLGVDRHFVMER